MKSYQLQLHSTNHKLLLLGYKLASNLTLESGVVEPLMTSAGGQQKQKLNRKKKKTETPPILMRHRQRAGR